MKVNSIYHNYCSYLSFLSRKDVSQKAEMFADELSIQASSGNLDLEKAQNIAQKYVPDIKIKELTQESDIYNNVGGTYSSNFVYFDSPNRVSTVNRNLKIRVDSDNADDLKEKIITISHEMAHAIQSADDEISDDKLITNALKKLPLSAWPEQVVVAGETFERLEKEILEPMIFAHQDLCANNNKLSPYDIFVNKTRMSKLVNDKLEEAKLENPNIDMDFLKKYVYLQAIDEFDAYMIEENVKKKFQGARYVQDEFIAYLYLCLANALGIDEDALL